MATITTNAVRAALHIGSGGVVSTSTFTLGASSFLVTVRSGWHVDVLSMAATDNALRNDVGIK